LSDANCLMTLNNRFFSSSLPEIKAFKNLSNSGRKGIDVAVQVGGDLIRVVQKPWKIHFRKGLKGNAGDLSEFGINNVFRFPF
jgi:hypothetical protein